MTEVEVAFDQIMSAINSVDWRLKYFDTTDSPFVPPEHAVIYFVNTNTSMLAHAYVPVSGLRELYTAFERTGLNHPEVVESATELVLSYARRSVPEDEVQDFLAAMTFWLIGTGTYKTLLIKGNLSSHVFINVYSTRSNTVFLRPSTAYGEVSPLLTDHEILEFTKRLVWHDSTHLGNSSSKRLRCEGGALISSAFF